MKWILKSLPQLRPLVVAFVVAMATTPFVVAETTRPSAADTASITQALDRIYCSGALEQELNAETHWRAIKALKALRLRRSELPTSSRKTRESVSITPGYDDIVEVKMRLEPVVDDDDMGYSLSGRLNEKRVSIGKIRWQRTNDTLLINWMESYPPYRESRVVQTLFQAMIEAEPDTNTIQGELVQTNGDVFRENLLRLIVRPPGFSAAEFAGLPLRFLVAFASPAQVERALIATPFYKLSARFGFTRIVRYSVTVNQVIEVEIARPDLGESIPTE